VSSLLEIRSAGMRFPGVQALKGVDLSVHAGEVHALVGHNGSGKSTLVRILAGEHQPDPGTYVSVDRQPMHFGSHVEAARLGLRFVHQHLDLVYELSATENIAMGTGYAVRGLRRIAWSKEHARTRREMDRLGYEIDPKRPVSELGASARTAVAVARALSDRSEYKPKVIVFDEATATMPLPEIDRFLGLVRGLRSEGIGILYVSHHLSEVLRIADRVTVLRDGVRVCTMMADECDDALLTRLIIGDSADGRRTNDNARFTRRPKAAAAAAEPAADGKADAQESTVLTVTNLSGELVDNVSFSARRGCVVGIAGISGSGREEIAELLVGALPRLGRVMLGDVELPPGRPDKAVKAGMLLVPADRARKALLQNFVLRENVTISTLLEFWRHGLLRKSEERSTTEDWIQRLVIRGGGPETPVTTLSGGNQQKAMVARSVRTLPKVLVVDEPTQGIDVGGVKDVHAFIRDLSNSCAVVVCSSDTADLVAVCRQVLILRHGMVTAVLTGDEISSDSIDAQQLA
jgi:ribose transport system ATP-binding protein